MGQSMKENIKMVRRMVKESSCGLIVQLMRETSKIMRYMVLVFNLNHKLGTYKWSDKRQYTGEWKDSKMNGSGTYYWPNGKTYTGGFVDDLKEGYGMMMWSNGKRYEGYWKEGKMHGKGKLITATGEVINGIWENGHRIDANNVY